MKKVPILLSILFTFGISTVVYADNPKLLVNRFEAKGGVKTSYADVFTNQLCTEMFNYKKSYDVVCYDDIKVIVSHKVTQLKMGTCDEDCVQKIGKLTNSQFVITGQISQVEDYYMINASLVDTDKGSVLKRATLKTKNDIDDLLKAVPELAKKLAGSKKQ